MSDLPTQNLPFEVNPKRINATIGAIAFLLPLALGGYAWLSDTTCFMTSISHFYYTRVGGDILVGALSVVGAVMVLFYVYKGDDTPGNAAHNRRNAVLARLAGLFALGVAFIPTDGVGCNYSATPEPDVSRFFLLATEATSEGAISGEVSYDFWSSLGVWPSGQVPFFIDNAHYVSATGMFLVLAYFSLVVFTRVQTPAATENRSLYGPKTGRKQLRNAIYYVMGGLMVAAMTALATKAAISGRTEFLTWWNNYHLTFWAEATALMAFGVSWAVKGRIFGLLDD